jgi:putative hydrolase of the HAD superfamily
VPLLPPAAPDVVFLDLGDTLVRANPSWIDVYARVFPEFGVSVDRAAFEREFEAVFHAYEDEGPFEATAEASFRRIVELDGQVFARLGHPDLPPAFFRRVEDTFAQRSAWWVFADVLPALDRLRAAGIRLGVISNWSWQAPELLHDLELARHFEVIVASARVGYQKPHPRIFEHALRLMGTSGGRAMHVGDSVRADVLGARAVGIAPVLIDRRTHSHVDDGARRVPDDVPLIHDLYELLDLLGLERPATAGQPAAASGS